MNNLTPCSLTKESLSQLLTGWLELDEVITDWHIDEQDNDRLVLDIGERKLKKEGEGNDG